MPVLPDIPAIASATTAANLIARLRDLLGEEAADFYKDDTELLPDLNEGAVKMFSVLDALPKSTSVVTVPLTAFVTIPADIGRYRSVSIGGSALEVISAVEYANLPAASGTPTSYCFEHLTAAGEPTLLLYPTPTSALTVRVDYYALPPALSVTAGQEVGATWHKRYHYLPCYYAAGIIFHKDNLPERAELMMAKFESGLAEYKAWLGRQTPPRVGATAAMAKGDM